MNLESGQRHQANPAVRASLGICANTVNAPAVKKPKRATGEDAADAPRRMRYQLQRAVQGLLPNERVKHCQRSCMNDSGVSIFRTASKGASFGNLATCGSVWHCPVCAAKITEQRRIELQNAITAWATKGGKIYLMSQTFPHQTNQSLEDNLKLFSDAQKRFKNSRAYKRVMERVGHVGSIRALEVTHGGNGWHPHTHTLVFAEPEQLELLKELDMVWIDTLIKIGLAERDQVNEMLMYAFDVQAGDYAAEYVAKFGHEPSTASKTITDSHWGASHELTKGHAKVGKRLSGRTPFTLLRDFTEGDSLAGELFIEYAKHFKGKRQLFWSPKLRKALELQDAEKTDEEIAVEQLEEREFVTVLDHDKWKLVLSRNARWDVLKAAESGKEAVDALLDELSQRSASHLSWYSQKGHYGGGWHLLNG